MKIAHFSDLHVLALEGISPWRFFNKRLTGWANLRFKRNHIHRAHYVRAIMREVRGRKVDHVVITGDITNLALETEFALAHEILEHELGLGPDEISIVPGNHDLYTRGALVNRRFTSFFSKYTKCDIDVAVDIGVGHFPFVKIRGEVAIIGLSTAVPRLPLLASGVIGGKQLGALDRALAHPEVKRRVPVLIQHHPVHNPPSPIKAFQNGLADAPALLARLRTLERGLLLHGHLHTRVQRPVGKVLAVGATSASLHHDHDAKMAGFNLYEIQGDRIDVEAHVYDPVSETFRTEPIPLVH